MDVMKKILLASTITFFMGFSANAAELERFAEVSLVAPITIVANDDLNFGKAELPSAGVDETIIVSPEGAVSGTATITSAAEVTAGSYTVSGDDTETIQITVSGTADDAGLLISDFVLSYGGVTVDNGSSGITAPGSGGTALNIGGTLNIPSDIESGVFTPAYTIEVEYQ